MEQSPLFKPSQRDFDLIVEVVRQIIDAVKPVRSYYTLETMPWMYPDSAESYQSLLQAVDRKAFAVHFNPVNLLLKGGKCRKALSWELAVPSLPRISLAMLC
ncbi:MAG: hypothetical protein NC823_00715 [Candidatus Omnitrophica bacterium]|nr:hypothetical protein [Candidatus Omnitrophota bacterium]